MSGPSQGAAPGFCNPNHRLPLLVLRCPARHLLPKPSSLRLAAMAASRLHPLGPRRDQLIFQLLACCLLPIGDPVQGSLMRVEPRDPVLLAGRTLVVNCSMECPQPELLFLETSFLKVPAGHGVGWAAFQLSNVTANSQVFCSGYCNGSQLTAASAITVFWFPETVELAPLPPWHPVGQNLTLSCLVTGGEPRAQLTLVLLRGEEELSRQPVLGEPAVVTATVLASRSDHGANFSCATELDLRPHGLGLFQNTSAPRRLRVFALPGRPLRLEAPRILEVGSSRQVQCILHGLFPVSEAQVHMMLGGQRLDTTVTSSGDTLTATATAHTHLEGSREIVCNVTLGGQSRQAQKNLTVYRFLGPVLNLSEAVVAERSTVTVTCTAGRQTQVMLDGAPVPPLGQPAQLQLHATERDDGRHFFCSGTLEVDGVVLHKNATVRLSVLYGPKIDRDKCPQHLVWKEKTTQVLRCQAGGNPVPRLQCLQEDSGNVVLIGIPFIVGLNYSGVYCCQATSPMGSATLPVEIDVRERNPASVGIVLGVLAILAVVIITMALIYVFGSKTRRGSYSVARRSTSIPLTARTPQETEADEVP
ncbi:intercellular adhesion molecule 3 [Perognathus longimembris pacificus]|uniref:intercellular adhesion molecule 3 n=1 Tax=Perognathus longimembris pacificus TaxID=214514 RepID=UPI002018A726|nr:intercellular adhesion molecule 3 [Perognathus longimembris pacificus]